MQSDLLAALFVLVSAIGILIIIAHPRPQPTKAEKKKVVPSQEVNLHGWGVNEEAQISQ